MLWWALIVHLAATTWAWLVVPRRRVPSRAVAWLLFITLVPFLGALLYVLFGDPKLPRRRRRRQRDIDALVASRVAASQRDGELPAVAAAWHPTAVLAQHLGGLPALPAEAAFITGYDEAFTRMAAAVDAATATVRVQFYILAMDAATEPLFAAVERAARRGVAVWVQFDHFGSLGLPGYRAMRRRLDRAGIRWQRLLPLLPFTGRYARPDLRNHRKLVVVDGHTAFVGSQNAIQRDYHEAPLRFIDTVTVVAGPVARALDTVFISDWYGENGELPAAAPLGSPAPAAPEAAALPPAPGPSLMGSLGQVLPSGPAYSYSNNMRVLVSLIYAARTSIVLVNPYFVPNTTVLTAITAAAQRGVSVSLVTHERGDSRFLSWAQRSYYSELLAAGVRVRILPHPTVLHSKTVIVDGEVAVVGSSNLDTRSLYLHLELDIVWYDPGMAAALMRLQDERHASGVELDAVQWRRRPRGGRALETLARLASDIL